MADDPWGGVHLRPKTPSPNDYTPAKLLDRRPLRRRRRSERAIAEDAPAEAEAKVEAKGKGKGAKGVSPPAAPPPAAPSPRTNRVRVVDAEALGGGEVPMLKVSSAISKTLREKEAQRERAETEMLYSDHLVAAPPPSPERPRVALTNYNLPLVMR